MKSDEKIWETAINIQFLITQFSKYKMGINRKCLTEQLLPNCLYKTMIIWTVCGIIDIHDVLFSSLYTHAQVIDCHNTARIFISFYFQDQDQILNPVSSN